MIDLQRLEDLARGVPDHIVNNGFVATTKPAFGSHFIYSDDGRGMGRQLIANVPADKKYFGTLSAFMAAVDPPTILALIARIRELEAR